MIKPKIAINLHIDESNLGLEMQITLGKNLILAKPRKLTFPCHIAKLKKFFLFKYKYIQLFLSHNKQVDRKQF